MAEIKNRLIEEEMKENYRDYAMSVIVGRALPDIRDGLKPVHRRILFAMNDMGLNSNKPCKKCARIVGEVLGKYHPHGDIAVYDSLVRMAQTFSLRNILIEGQGNFGSVDGDSPAAMRYCISGDSLIVTEKGLQRLDTISNEEKLNIKIMSKDKKIHNASKWFNSGEHETIKITTNKGYNLTGTYNHPILILTIDDYGKPIFRWKLLEQIKEGDVAVLDRLNDEFWPEENVDLKKYFPMIKNKCQHIRILPEKLNNDLAIILGLLISEGSISKNKLEFCNTDEELVKIFERKWKKIFPDSTLHKFKAKPSSYGKKDYFRLECHCRYTLEFLRNIGINVVKSDRKTIPNSIFLSPKEILCSFLKAYFEGDGCITYSNKMIELSCCSKSKELINQLQILLLRLGIESFNRYDKWKFIDKLIIRNKRNVSRFYKEIGFLCKRKSAKLEFIVLNYKKECSSTDYVPFISDFVRSLSHNEFITKHNFDRYSSMEKNYQKVVSILLEKTNSDYSSIFEYLLTYQYLFDKIVKVEKTGIQKVYSLKVDSNCHSFISNGFISHNTEARLSKIAEEILEDLDKETVNFVPNFDGSLKEPVVLPSKFPNLLVNGSSGIAVGMATNIPPHNVAEVIDAIAAQIDNPNIDINDLLKIVKGPDFPTGAYICNVNSIKETYLTGRGLIRIRSKAHIEEKGNRNRIIVTEIPYQVNKSLLLENMAELTKDKRVEGISDIRDESSKEGIRVIIELKQDANPDVVLNQLFKHSQLEITFGAIMLALVNNEPKVLNLKEIISYYILHRKEIVTKRTQFELREAEAREHVVTGLLIALSDIDNVVKLIKGSHNVEEARKGLTISFSLSEIQANAILDMKLQRLTSLENEKLRKEKEDLLKLIKELREILSSEERIYNIIKSELLELKKYSTPRKTEIINVEETLEEELIPEEEVIVMLTHGGYIKRVPVDIYKQQKRGGKGVIGTETKEEDFVENVFSTSTHNNLLFFTDKGRVFCLKAYELPVGTRYNKGKAIINILQLKDEKVSASIPIKGFSEGYLLMVTKNGTLKKTKLDEFVNIRKTGIIAINLKEKDELVDVRISSGEDEIIIATKDGSAARFSEKNVQAIGRNASGVRGIKLDINDEVIGFEVGKAKYLLSVTENGYGKRTELEEYRLINRGGKGVINIITSERNGKVVDIKNVCNEDEVILVSKKGITIRMNVKDISVIGRNTQGVRLMKLDEGDKVISLAKIVED